MAKPFKVGDFDYQARDLDVFEQLHVSRRFGSVLIFLGSMKADENTSIESRAKAMVATASRLDNEDVDYAVNACLAVVDRKQGAGWAPVKPSGAMLMFKDLDLKALMEIVWNVLDANGLIDFFYVAPSSSSEAGPGQPSS